MDHQIRALTKAQEPWIGPRGRIGVIIPSTNIGVEYDCQRIIPPGVTWHFARFFRVADEFVERRHVPRLHRGDPTTRSPTRCATS